MRIRQVHIKNWRSVVDANLWPESLTTLIGPNSHGKSNVVEALGWFLSPSRKAVVRDFTEISAGEQIQMSVEVYFDELSTEESAVWRDHLRSDGTLRLGRRARDPGSGEYYCHKSEPADTWLREDGVDGLKAEGPDACAARFDTAWDSGRFSAAKIRRAQAKFIDERRASISFQERNVALPKSALQSLPNWIHVPAIHAPGAELKLKSTTVLGQLMRAIHGPDFAEQLLRTSSVTMDVNDELLKQAAASVQREMSVWSDSDLHFELETPSSQKIVEMGLRVMMDDGVVTLAEEKGMGAQRALLLAMARALMSALRGRESSESYVLAIEEPELYLHPQAERALAAEMAAFADQDGRQVFITTHSTRFVDLERRTGIAIVKKSARDEGTTIQQSRGSMFEGSEKKRFNSSYWMNPDRSELLFARRAILVEGPTESAVIPMLARRMGVEDHAVSVIDCGGENNLALYVEIATSFGIDVSVVRDSDGDLTADEYAGVDQVVFHPDIEKALGVPESKRQQSKPSVALRHLQEAEIGAPLEHAIRHLFRSSSGEAKRLVVRRGDAAEDQGLS